MGNPKTISNIQLLHYQKLDGNILDIRYVYLGTEYRALISESRHGLGSEVNDNDTWDWYQLSDNTVESVLKAVDDIGFPCF